MSGFFSGYLEKLGSNFLTAALIPAFGLVISVLTVFDPYIQTAAMFKDQDGIYQAIGIGVLVLIPTVIIGFTLTALNTYILKFFEGYVFLHHFSFLRDQQVTKARKLTFRRQTLKKRIDVLTNWQDGSDRLRKIRRKLEAEYYDVTARYDKNFPPEEKQILPTQFGNILKASEAYSGTRYGIDGVEFWPRLYYVIPPSYKQLIGDARNQLSFLVNISIVSLVFTALCLLPIVYIISYSALMPVNSVIFTEVFKYSYRYLLAGLVSCFCVFFFQRASIFAVGGYGIMIRSAYDLFRLDLLKLFHVGRPNNIKEEFQMWRNLGQLILLGQHQLSFKQVDYQFDDPLPVGEKPDEKQP